MKKTYLFLIAIVLWSNVGFGQCTTLITLSSQSEIDNFVTNYGCTTINGSLQISGSDITNLNGLSQITSVSGTLYVYSNPILTAVSFPALTTVGDALVVFDNSLLSTINLPNLTSFGNSVYFTENAALSAINLPALTNVTGYMDLSYHPALTSINFPLLTTVGNYLSVTHNQNLATISLPSLTTVNGFLTIGTNPALTSLSGLATVTSTVGLDINNNPGLTNLSGIESINPAALTSLNIYSNIQLATCNASNICTYILNGGSSYVNGNAPGCATVTQVKVSCGVPQNCDFVTLLTQAEIDNFPLNYGCTSISGFLTISGNDITNFNGLAQLVSVGHLNIANVPTLTDYSGLNGLTTITGNFSLSGVTATTITAFPALATIGGHFNIVNTSLLESFTGFQNLTAIGGDLNVFSNTALTQLPPFILLSAIGTSPIGGYGFLTISNNPALQNVNSLSALTSIDGNFQISNNDALTSIQGIKNIDPDTIIELRLGNNPLLSLCNVDSVCYYISTSTNYFEIYNNAPGCESVPVVIASCVPDCPTEDVFLTTQALVDAFGFGYPNCTSLDVNLTISGADITNLDALSGITFISGSVTVNDNPFLTSLTGLHNIVNIGGSLVISRNDILTDMIGLDALTIVGGSFSIDDNSALLNLDGLSDLVNVVDDLRIRNNPSLEDLSGLSSLTAVPDLEVRANDSLTNLSGLNNLANVSYLSIEGNALLNDLTALESLPNTLNNLHILGNSSLTTLNGLSNLQSVHELWVSGNDVLPNLSGLETITSLQQLQIYSNEALVDLTGLDSVTNTVENPLGQIVIQGNNSLTSLDGLNGIHFIGARLKIAYNPMLVDFSGLNGLQSVGELIIDGNYSLIDFPVFTNLTQVHNLEIIFNPQLVSLSALDNPNLQILTSLRIQDNPNLTTCNAASICAYLSGTGFRVISFNAPGCDSQEEVIDACGSKDMSLEFFIQGYYNTATNNMRSVKFNQDGVSPLTDVADVRVELREATAPYNIAYTTTALLKNNGMLFCENVWRSGSYYIVLVGNNFIRTWSAAPVLFDGNPVLYDFTTAASKAYGDNMAQLEPEVFGLYSGDLNQDGNIDTIDYPIWEMDSNNFESGMFNTDLNGDGNVDTIDYPIWEGNSNNFIYSISPSGSD